MKSRDELRRENKLLRDRISKLSQASLRTSASLDVSTVLQEIVESARTLTGARYGVITTLDDSGQLHEFVSSGFTPDEHRQLEVWPIGPRIFERLRHLPEPVRMRDFPSYVRSLGLSPHPILPKTFQGTPMRYRGVHVGSFFLAAKKGGREFTSEDEDVLVMFAAQAATAIANARAFRDEQRARGDLEALVDISPVGVVVFDAKSGKLVSVNREAKRIGEGLLKPGQPLENLLEVMTLRRPDGWEISLEEFPVAQALSNASTIRAEEIVLQVPDGRSVSTLINTAPIRSETGTIDSVIVTMQDLAPLQEMERLRAEFLGMVSHELRAPLTSIMGSTNTVLRALPTPNQAEILEFIRIIDEQAHHMRSLISDLLDAGHIETGTLSVNPEPTEVADLVEQARKTFVSAGGRNPVLIDLPLDLPRVMADLQRIVQVLNNLLSNAALNSPGSSPIRIAAERKDLHLAISISDEGRGVPPDLLPHLFRKHVRMGGDRGILGSGLGLAICKGLVEAHGGRIRAESAGSGLGARFTFTIPVAEDAGSDVANVFAPGSSHPRRDGKAPTPILVVDDDPQTLVYVRNALTAAGYSPLTTGDPKKVAHLIQRNNPQLVLMDLMLPGTDGIELMQRLPELADLPVIFISGYGRDETIARALKQGATDYIVKPFSTTELVARVQAALRRDGKPPEPFRLGDLHICYQERRVTVADRPVKLTATEYELLRVLTVNTGQVMTYASLLRQVWNRPGTADLRPLRAVVKLLRRKLGDNAAQPTYIFNERRVGYYVPRQDEP